MNKVTVALAAALAAVLAISYVQISTLQSQYWKLHGDYMQLNLSYVKLSADYTRLKSDYTTLSQRYDELSARYGKLEKDYSRLTSDYASLKDSYNRLTGEYTSLQNLHLKTRDELDKIKKNYTELSGRYETIKLTYNEWLYYYYSFLFIQLSFQRVFSDDEIRNLAPLVRKITTDPSDPWRSEFELYRYVIKNIEYTEDVYVPLPPRFQDLEGGVFTRKLFQQTVQAPSETLERGAGDCEDLAILLYAMIKAWQKYVYGKEYTLWLMLIEMNDGIGHAAVASPVEGGRISILDPAGEYYTGTPGRYRSEDPYTELRRYSDRWSDEHGGIKRIVIYNPTTGEKVVEGDIYTVAQFIKTR